MTKIRNQCLCIIGIELNFLEIQNAIRELVKY